MTRNATDPTPAFAEAMAGAQEMRVRPTPAAAFARARDEFRRGIRLDMGRLATDLGVGRTTLYRWTGDRERLLADICLAELDDFMAYLDRTTDGRGAARLEQLLSRFLSGLAGNTAFQHFLEHEGEHGFRLVTAADSRVRQHLVAALTERIQRETATNNYRPPADPPTLADGVVAIAERFLYHNGSPELNPDPTTARVVIELLLRES